MVRIRFAQLLTLRHYSLKGPLPSQFVRALPGLALPRRCSLAERLRVRRSKKMF